MPLYDFLARAYDPVFEEIYLPFRRRVFAQFPVPLGARVLDLACGSGQNFPLLADQVGPSGHIIGMDISRGMLRCARARSQSASESPRITFIHSNAAMLTPTLLEAETGIREVDVVLCTYGFTSMRDPETAFHVSWDVLKPGGTYLILDIHAKPRTLHSCAVEWATCSRFTPNAWQPLRNASSDFRMDYLDPSAHLFGGRVFVASGTKTQSPTRQPKCP